MVDLLAAGQLVVATALAAWERRIVDAPRGKIAEPSRQFIADIIGTPVGLDWSWLTGEDAYHGDGDYEWCGAFGAGFAWGAAGLDLDIRRMYGSSTQRLNAWAQYKPFFGSAHERELIERFPKPVDPAERRRFLVLDEHTAPDVVTEWAPRAGDILLCGGVPGSYRGALAMGNHVTIVEGWDPVAGVFTTVEGNATGRGPDGTTYQGVIRQTRPVGLKPGSDRRRYHARRLIRPGVNDITGAVG